MSRYFIFSIILLCVFQSDFVSGQANTTRKLCYNFSWLGPKFNNETVFSGITCDNVTKSAGNVPCRHPLVISHDGTLPNMTYLWENFLEDSTCLLTDDEVCAKYTYSFNGFIQNITYMCTKVVDENQQAVSSAQCMSSSDGSRRVDLCICSSNPGESPCNGASPPIMIYTFLITLIFVLWSSHSWERTDSDKL